jgi:hypothetical protein
VKVVVVEMRGKIKPNGRRVLIGGLKKRKKWK